jgi:histidinol dehydrogenase
MKNLDYKNISSKKIDDLFKRPAMKTDDVLNSVKQIVETVKNEGDSAVFRFARMFDGLRNKSIIVSKKEINAASKKLSPEIKKSIDAAADNIAKFHSKQIPNGYSIETMPGVKCSRKFVPIESVGLYIPGGSAILFSTMLMLGIPAKIAGCKRIVVSTPVGKNGIEPALAYSIKKCGIEEVYCVGGAHAIAMMAYGTKKIKKVDKIFGPGNQFVTAAKTLVSIDLYGCAIDMPAGPSEVLVIADDTAVPSFVAADLLSQAEHGADSQVILLTTSAKLADEVQKEINLQLSLLPRKSTAEKCLKNSLILKVPNIKTAVALSNKYAPEHLIVSIKNPESILDEIINAGSVFVGNYSPESAGDYASGTNHSLPTYGYAKSYSGVNVESFMKGITYQTLSEKGLERISITIINLAETEKLDAHANAVKIRLKK